MWGIEFTWNGLRLYFTKWVWIDIVNVSTTDCVFKLQFCIFIFHLLFVDHTDGELIFIDVSLLFIAFSLSDKWFLFAFEWRLSDIFNLLIIPQAFLIKCKRHFDQRNALGVIICFSSNVVYWLIYYQFNFVLLACLWQSWGLAIIWQITVISVLKLKTVGYCVHHVFLGKL